MWTLMTGISRLSSGSMNVAWAAVVGAAWFWRGKKREAGVLFFGTALGAAMIDPLKALFHTARPPAGAAMPSYSFPSGHALATTVLMTLLAGLLSRRHPKRQAVIIGGAAAVAILVSWSRVYLGVHYVRDV